MDQIKKTEQLPPLDINSLYFDLMRRMSLEQQVMFGPVGQFEHLTFGYLHDFSVSRAVTEDETTVMKAMINYRLGKDRFENLRAVYSAKPYFDGVTPPAFDPIFITFTAGNDYSNVIFGKTVSPEWAKNHSQLYDSETNAYLREGSPYVIYHQPSDTSKLQWACRVIVPTSFETSDDITIAENMTDPDLDTQFITSVKESGILSVLYNIDGVRSDVLLTTSHLNPIASFNMQ